MIRGSLRDGARLGGGRIYVIEAVGTSFVKIGWTAGPASIRLADLQVGCPLELRLVVTSAGDLEREAFLHARFAPWRERGEWFRREGEVARWIEWLVEEVDNQMSAVGL